MKKCLTFILLSSIGMHVDAADFFINAADFFKGFKQGVKQVVESHRHYVFDEKAAKENIVFSNGKNLKTLEAELQSKYQGTPIFRVVKDYGCFTDGMQHKVLNPAYSWLDYSQQDFEEQKSRKTGVVLMPEMINQMSYDSANFITSHELGHSQLPYAIPVISALANISYWPIAYYWKKRFGAGPYRNRLTKHTSKLLAAYGITTFASGVAVNLEERRADNFAIKHSDAKALKGGIEYLKTSKNSLQNEYQKHAVSRFLPFSIGWKYLDPTHPSLDSRIAKIERALHKRFAKDN
ncbi:M48 family metalloprotease [Candidatus Babeliales bacterium]|nr:M48 family metalloprotease [Candidatus Babeliales bacterium]